MVTSEVRLDIQVVWVTLLGPGEFPLSTRAFAPCSLFFNLRVGFVGVW